eukprot:CAMPEP_0202905928 /NCGR_PEP_ID=MMETSP1392-20130828/36646_1 /ASSEMBLY_ACC=CAM_ASM_000868 /TAXON_ID=225041 /ORGANISM="Chlamydomonas chlamydogama, Strain SAG 11-48b" /LENGTH=138 /DNA_ID=CAMNT_0049594239 /DNA_START=135 /DNA_END=547 /DNA_ORIENTATION=+
MAASGTAVLTAFLIQFGITGFMFLLFSYLRTTPWLRRFFQPKRFDKSIKVKPKRLPPGLFSWWWFIYTCKEEDVIDVAGLDSAAYLRCLSVGWEIFFYLTLWTLIVILPVNLSGDAVQVLLDRQDYLNSRPSPPPFPP